MCKGNARLLDLKSQSALNSDDELVDCLKKNLYASRPSEHPSVRGKEMSKRLGGIISCKNITSSWHLNGFPDGSNIESTV